MKRKFEEPRDATLREQYDALRVIYASVEMAVRAGEIDRIPELTIRRAELDALKVQLRAAP